MREFLILYCLLANNIEGDSSTLFFKNVFVFAFVNSLVGICTCCVCLWVRACVLCVMLSGSVVGYVGLSLVRD